MWESKKKRPPPTGTPISPKFVLDAAILARKRRRGDGCVRFKWTETPLRTAYAPDQSHTCVARLEVNEPYPSISRS